MIVVARILVAAYWKMSKASTSLTIWFSKLWNIVLMHKLSVIVTIRAGDGQALPEVQNTWETFITFWDKLYPRGKAQSMIWELQ